MLSLISTLIKTFFGYLTQIDYDIGLISIQKLNKRLANTNLLNFYKALIFYGKSKTYKIVKELHVFAVTTSAYITNFFFLCNTFFDLFF